MKTLPGIATTMNAQIARSDLSFFDLDEIFALWFYDPTSIRAFFHSTKSIYEYGGKVSANFPMGVWHNLQISIDRVAGYEMRVFDIARREISRAKESVYLYE